MTELRQVNKQEFLKELKKRVTKKEISEQEVFKILESPKKTEIITKYKKTNLEKLSAGDWKKACETLAKDKNYQEEVKLWDSIDDE